MWDAVLLDFDGTLADTAHLGRSTGVDITRVTQCSPATTVRGEPTTQLVHRLAAQNTPMAIVTNSPRQVAMAWLDTHEINLPVFGNANKPDKRVLLQAVRHLGVITGDRVVLVDDSVHGAIAADKVGISCGTFHPDGDLNEPATFFAPDIASFFETEKLLRLTGDAWRLGEPALLSTTIQGYRGFVAGRYRKQEARNHPLSNDLRNSKNLGRRSRWPQHLTDARDLLISMATRQYRDPIVTWIPPHGNKPDRMAGLFSNCPEVDARPLLTFRRATSQQRGLDPRARARNVDGALQAGAVPHGRPVMVFDDVTTTGATLAEAGRALAAEGVTDIAVLVIAKTSYREFGSPATWCYQSDPDTAGGPSSSSRSTDLFEVLRALRKRLADERELPAFVVFHDRSLRDMVDKMPTSRDEFSAVYGVGDVKLREYGTVFLDAIRDWEASGGHDGTPTA